MKAVTSRLVKVLVFTMLFAATVTTASPRAADPCTQWDLNGQWLIVHPNSGGYSPMFTLKLTEAGPGALAIRDALSPAAQRGFNQGANFLLPGGFGFSDSPTVKSDSPTVKKDDYFGAGGATGRTQDAFQPENTLKITVRYKKEFGYITDSNAFGYVGPTSCGAFSVSVIAGDGTAQRLSPSRISGSDAKMVEQSGYYFCNYIVSFLPLNQPLKVDVRVIGSDLSSSWKNGSQSQPPPGQQRTIIIVSGRDNGPLQLTSSRSKARRLYEMVYTSQPR